MIVVWYSPAIPSRSNIYLTGQTIIIIMSDEFPTPLEIKALAEDYGYVERRSEVSYTLFFREDKPEQEGQPILINIFYTTRGIMTKLPHPKQGYNEMWRRTAYDSLESLAMFFENPRTHSGKGYRQAKNALSGCAQCGMQKKKKDYTPAQWRKGAGKCICKDCSSGGSNEDSGANGEGQVPTLTLEALEQHNRLTIKNENKTLERRQFNCPVCPKEGRGKQCFFKRVPQMKPICKCPKCKKIKQDDCERLYPIPKGEEKGYGHYRCTGCKSTWGSSRSIANVGQECHSCNLAGKPNVFIKPFRVEVYKSGHKGGIAGGGARPAGRRMRRVPKEPISEDSTTDGAYSSFDAQRFQSKGGGSNSLDRTSASSSFDWQVVNEEQAGEETAPPNSRLAQYKPSHKCEGCATGICRSRKLPVSGVHDLHDGDTASTSGSIMTNSVVDKSEFPDRDIDFDDWEDDDDGSDIYVTVGSNGKILRG